MSDMGQNKKYKRNGGNGAILIVVVSTVVMVLCMALFFAGSMKQANDAPAADTTPTTQNVSSVTDSVEKEDSEMTEKGEDEKNPPPETEKPVETEATVETEAPAPQTEAKDTEEQPKTETPVVSGQYDAALLARVALPEGTAPEGYVDKLVFFGDSTTHGMKAYKVFGSRETTQVWTPTSGTLALFRAMTDLIYNPNTGEEQLIGDLAKSVKPEYLIMTLGVNGVSFMDEDYFKSEYQNVVNAILENSPDTTLILQTIYPVAKSYENQESINNQKISAANEWIAEIADAYHLPFLNTYSALANEEGYLPETYQNGDGMHLNESGFAVILDYVKRHPAVK